MGLEMPKYTERWLAYSASGAATYSRADIIAYIRAGKGSLKDWVFAILNQTTFPWCWAFAPTQALMVNIALTTGQKIILDPCVGPLVTGVRGGNAIDAMVSEVQSVYGQPLASITGNDPVTGRLTSRIGSEWRTDAAKRVVPETHWPRHSSILEAASGIINAHPGVIGTGAFGGGHAVCVAEVGVENDSETLFLAGPNSWGMSSNYRQAYPGRPGWWKLSENSLRDVWHGYGSYSLCGAIVRDEAAPQAA